MRIRKRWLYIIIYIGAMCFLFSCKTCDCPAYSQTDGHRQPSSDLKIVCVATVMQWQGKGKNQEPGTRTITTRAKRVNNNRQPIQ
jgi:hypothetical protein